MEISLWAEVVRKRSLGEFGAQRKVSWERGRTGSEEQVANWEWS